MAKKMFKRIGLLRNLADYGISYDVYNPQRYTYQLVKTFKRRKHARKFAKR